MQSRRTIPFLLSVFPVLPLFAQAAEDSPQDLAALLATPVVASSKREQPLLQSPQAIEVLRGRDLRTMGIFRLADALKLMTSLDVLDHEGSAPTFSVRGSMQQGAPRSMQILVDGVPLYNGEFGGNDLDILPVPLDLLDRVEVVRGPSSALYGANAVSGVLSLTTLKPAEGLRATARVARGEHGTSRWTATADLGASEFALLGGVSGFSYRPVDAPTQYLSNGSPRTLDDEAGHELTHFLRGEWRPIGNTLWLATGRARKTFSLTHGASAIPNIPTTPYYRDSDEFLQAGWAHDWSSTLRSELRLAHTRAIQTSGPNPGLTFVFGDPGYQNPEGYHLGQYFNRLIEVQLNWTPDPSLRFAFGADARRDEAAKAYVLGLKQDAHESASGAFVNMAWTPQEIWCVDLGLRAENATLGGSRFSPRIVLSVFPSTDSALRAGYYQSTRNPLIFEARGDLSIALSAAPPNPQARIIPNPDLKPETTASYEVGYRQGWGPFSLDLTLFHMRFERLITQVAVPVPPPPPLVVVANGYVNQGDATTQGIELTLGWLARPGWMVGANATYLDAKGADGLPATYAPHFKSNLWVRAMEGPISGHLAYQYLSSTTMDVQPLIFATGRRTPRDPIHQLQGQLSWELRPGLEVGAYARNALRDLTPQGGTAFMRSNLLLSERREYGISLALRR